RANVRQRFADAATMRGVHRPNPNSPLSTANALLRYFEHQGVDAPAMVRRGLVPFQQFYAVLPTDWDEMARLMVQPYEHDPAGIAFARSRAEVNAQLAREFETQRIDAMIYPTMPFPAPRVVDNWPDIRTTLGYGNWLGLPEVSVPSGL